MAPRSGGGQNSVGMSVSTTSSSLYTEDNDTSNPPSIEVVSVSLEHLDDPSKMSPQAIKAELKYYGVDLPGTDDPEQLMQALAFHRSRSRSGGSSAKGAGSVKKGIKGGSGVRHHDQKKKHHQHPQYQRQQNMLQRPTPEQPPAQHLEQTAAKVPGVRVTPPPPSSQQQHEKYNNNHKYSTNNSGNNPTHIPLTPSNRIPPQILNIIRTSADTTMKAINLDHRNLGDREVIKLAEALEKNRTVEFLSLRNCAISDEAVSRVGDMLLRNTKLAQLHLDANRITAEGAAALSTALITNETLSVLTLDDNRGVGDKGVVSFIGALEHNTTLKTLGVENCGVNEAGSLGGGGGSSKGSSRKKVNRLEQIESLLADRQIDANFESLLERLLDDDYRVTGIDLSGRRIGDKGVARLAEALVDNTQVRQLWLRGCNVGDPGAKALASCLEQNMTIVDLFLANNSVGNAGLVAISDALESSNLTLVSLEMDNNRVGEPGLDALTRALEKNTSVLVASFDNNSINNSGKLETLKATLTKKRNGLNLVSFVVDPDGTSSVEGGNNGSGLVNMSVCSSYMPSTYRRAGLSSQGSGGKNNLSAAANAAARGSGEPHQFSVYNRSPVMPRPPPPPPKSRPPLAQQVASSNTGAARASGSSKHGSANNSKSTKSSSGSANHKSSSVSGGAKPTGLARSVSSKKKAPPVQLPPTPNAKPKAAPAPRAPSPPPFARSNVYQRAHVPVPLKAQALDTIAESEARSSATGQGSNRSRGSSKNSRSSAIQQSGSAAISSKKYQFTSQQSEMNLGPVSEADTIATSFAKNQRRAATTTDLDHVVDEHTIDHTTITESIQHPQTQLNFNTTLKKLWRRVEMMKRTNHFAAAHYRARHFWFWFVPISSTVFLTMLLCLATAADVSGASRVGLSLFAALFATVALFLNFVQASPRFRGGSWSNSRAEVHRSAEVELGQVAFRLDTLGKYDGRGLTSGSHSTKSRANAIRDLYRIDVYLQAMQRCTPEIPQSINDVFYLLAQRLKNICRKYPNAVKLRTSAYAYYEDEVSPENPVPVEMQIDALDLLGREIQNYFMYPLFMPNAQDVVSRTIDIFFAKSEEDRSRRGDTVAATDYSPSHHEDETQGLV